MSLIVNYFKQFKFLKVCIKYLKSLSHSRHSAASQHGILCLKILDCIITKIKLNNNKNLKQYASLNNIILAVTLVVNINLFFFNLMVN